LRHRQIANLLNVLCNFTVLYQLTLDFIAL